MAERGDRPSVQDRARTIHELREWLCGHRAVPFDACGLFGLRRPDTTEYGCHKRDEAAETALSQWELRFIGQVARRDTVDQRDGQGEVLLDCEACRVGEWRQHALHVRTYLVR